MSFIFHTSYGRRPFGCFLPSDRRATLPAEGPAEPLTQAAVLHASAVSGPCAAGRPAASSLCIIVGSPAAVSHVSPHLSAGSAAAKVALPVSHVSPHLCADRATFPAALPATKCGGHMGNCSCKSCCLHPLQQPSFFLCPASTSLLGSPLLQTEMLNLLSCQPATSHLYEHLPPGSSAKSYCHQPVQPSSCLVVNRPAHLPAGSSAAGCCLQSVWQPSLPSGCLSEPPAQSAHPAAAPGSGKAVCLRADDGH